ncbi:MAG: formimidoylglutamate deiminase [Gammaproteobacteria bacterium]|jgi:formimidoylglutamate deiminase
MQRTLTFRHVMTPAGMVNDCRLRVSPEGLIEALEPDCGEARDGWLALPGMPNAHSHVFQRALAGHGEVPRGNDSFWSWRDAMYRLAQAITPEDMHVIACQAFAEMLAAGYTSLAEFHYLHHGRDGGRGLEMAEAVIEAAEITGLSLTLLPVCYLSGGFGTEPLPEQYRFVHASVDEYLGLLDRLKGRVALGVAPHSLRAVPLAQLGELVRGAESLLGTDFPFHIHISEQRQEVEQSRETLGVTPIRALAEHVELSSRWHLVHATHATADERELMRRADVDVVLCPLTEAYLGDGLFAATEWCRHGARWSIGSDSNCLIDPVAELRCLEFGQRLGHERRSLLADETGLGRPLWEQAAQGGAGAVAAPAGSLAIGQRADLVVLDESAAALAGHGPDTVLDALVIGGGRHDFAAVYAGGVKLAEHGRHQQAERFRTPFAETARRLARN